MTDKIMFESVLDGRYTIRFKIKRGFLRESFRIKSGDGKNYFFKLIDIAKTDPSEFTSEVELREFELLRSIEHPSVAKYVESGTLSRKRKDFAYLVCEFISGESLAQLLDRDNVLDPYSIIQISMDVLEALGYLHGLSEPVYHNAIEPDNIMLDLSSGSIRGRLCGFGFASRKGQAKATIRLSPGGTMYHSNDLLRCEPVPGSDLFSLGVVIFRALYGMDPWSEELLGDESDLPLIQKLVEVRKKPLKIPNVFAQNVQGSDGLTDIIKRALSPNPDLQFKSAAEFSQALLLEKQSIVSKFRERETGSPGLLTKPKHTGKGFSEVAGMQFIKDLLLNDVLQILNDQEGARQYGISIPNGILFYGPPGCGKTFIAEKFAEEASYNYVFIRSSDLASIYIHGSQQKIGALFKEAREKKPSIICFDELDALVQHRDEINNASMSGEVNEFLTQLNNCGKDGILVIGTTNRPDLIDPAVLRKGRIDKIIYIPPPDLEARLGLFRILLAGKPVDTDIDLSELAGSTEGRVCSDIDFIVSEAARIAYKGKRKISMESLCTIIKSTNSSLTPEQDEFYEKMKGNYEGACGKLRSQIGFKL